MANQTPVNQYNAGYADGIAAGKQTCGSAATSTSTTQSTTNMTSTLWLQPTTGAITGSTIKLSYDKTGFYDTTQMYNDGFKNANGKFAMYLYNFGSGCGGLTVTPKPDRYTVIGKATSTVNGTCSGKQYFIASLDAQNATVLVEWDSIPKSLSYDCDDYCLASKVGSAIGISSDGSSTYNQGYAEGE